MWRLIEEVFCLISLRIPKYSEGYCCCLHYLAFWLTPHDVARDGNNIYTLIFRCLLSDNRFLSLVSTTVIDHCG